MTELITTDQHNTTSYNMFGKFTGYKTGTNKEGLPALENLVIAFEIPGGFASDGVGTPLESNYVNTLFNEAPNYPNTYNLSGVAEPTMSYLYGSTKSDMFGYSTNPNDRGYILAANAANKYYYPSAVLPSSPAGYTVVMLQRSYVSGSDYAWRLTKQNSGETITGYFNAWNDAGTNRHRFQVTATGGNNVFYNTTTPANSRSGRNFYAYTTDFSTSTLYLGLGLGTTGGAFVSRSTDSATAIVPDTQYTFDFLGTTTSRPAFDTQALYVWDVGLSASQITEVQDYLNNTYILTL